MTLYILCVQLPHMIRAQFIFELLPTATLKIQQINRFFVVYSFISLSRSLPQGERRVLRKLQRKRLRERVKEQQHKRNFAKSRTRLKLIEEKRHIREISCGFHCTSSTPYTINIVSHFIEDVSTLRFVSDEKENELMMGVMCP